MILNHTMSLKLFLQTIFLYLFFLLILNLSFNINEIHNNDMIRANLLGIFLNYIYFSIIIYLFFSYPKSKKKEISFKYFINSIKILLLFECMIFFWLTFINN